MIDFRVCSAWCVSCLDQLDHSHRSQGHLLCSFPFHGVRDGACYVKRLHRDPIATRFRRGQFRVVDHIVRDDIFLDFTALGSDNIIGSSARCDEN